MALSPTYILTVDLVEISGADAPNIQVSVELYDPQLVYPVGVPTEALFPTGLNKTTDAKGVAEFNLVPSSLVGNYRVKVGSYERVITMPKSNARLSALGEAERPGMTPIPTTGGLNRIQVDARVQAALSAAVTGNTETGIDVIYNQDGTLDFDVAAGTGTGGGLTQSQIQTLIDQTDLSALSGKVTNAQIPSGIMRDSELTADAVRGLLNLSPTEVEDLLIGGSISGRQLTFTQNDGSVVTINLPQDTDTHDGVIQSGAFDSGGTKLTLTLADNSTIIVSVPSALRVGTGAGVDTAGVNQLVAAALTAAVTGNTETNIAVTYNAADGTLDFVVAGDASKLTQTQVDDRIKVALAAAVQGNTETGIVVTYNVDGTIDFVIKSPVQTHTNYVGITSNALSAVTASDFTVHGDTEALILPTYSGVQRLLFARPASESDPIALYLYQSTLRNTINQIHTFSKGASTVQLNGEAYNWWGTVDSQRGFGGYTLEQVN